MQFPKLGISLRSLKRDGSDFSERVNEVSNYNPFSIELMGFAQDLIFNGNLNQQRIDILNQELERFSGKKTFHGPMVVNFLDKKDNLKDYEKLTQSYIDLSHKLNAEKIIISEKTINYNKPIASQISKLLYQQEITSLIVEGGATTLNTFINEKKSSN